MKKLLILFVFLSINYFSYSQEFEKSNSVPVEYDDSFIDKTNNVLRVKFDEHFVSKQEDIKDIAIDYLKEYHSQYGIRDWQFFINAIDKRIIQVMLTLHDMCTALLPYNFVAFNN